MKEDHRHHFLPLLLVGTSRLACSALWRHLVQMITILRRHFHINFRTVTVALFRADSGHRIEKVNRQIRMPISQRDENENDPEGNN
jgi:hypothetical protein